MQILISLGVDSTLWIQLGCFLVSYLALTQLVLKPYMAALREREKRTVGNEESAVRLIEQANELHVEYEKKAREINGRIRSFYDQSRTAASQEYDRIVSAAREAAAVELERTRELIGQEIQGARKLLSAEVPAVSAAIASKLAGKEISA